MLASDVLVADPSSRSPSAESVSSTSTNAGGVSNASGHILALKDASGRMVKVTVWDGTGVLGRFRGDRNESSGVGKAGSQLYHKYQPVHRSSKPKNSSETKKPHLPNQHVVCSLLISDKCDAVGSRSELCR